MVHGTPLEGGDDVTACNNILEMPITKNGLGLDGTSVLHQPINAELLLTVAVLSKCYFKKLDNFSIHAFPRFIAFYL